MDQLIGQRPTRPPTPERFVPAGGLGPARVGGAVADTPDGMIVEGSQATFMADVIDASRSVPVVVDFWATWCGPCKTLTPTLERIVRSAAGRVKLVKIDIDKNQALVRQLAQLGLPLQSVPTVAAFWQGQIADLFQGALPDSEVKRFVEALLKLGGGTMPTAELLAEARVALEQGKAEDAAELFAALLEQEPDNPDAWGGFLRTLIVLGREDEARAALADVPAALADHAEIAGARSTLSLAEEGRKAQAQLGSLQARLATDQSDHAARYELATALNAMGRRDDAAAALLDILQRERGWNEGAARLQLLKFFEAWGLDDAVTVAARRKLSALLFS